jgi:hypothetical protein
MSDASPQKLLYTIVIPGTVTVLVPYLIVSGNGERSLQQWGLLQVLGLVAMALGATVLLRCIWEFMVSGRGCTRNQCCTGASAILTSGTRPRCAAGYRRDRLGSPGESLGSRSAHDAFAVALSAANLRVTCPRVRLPCSRAHMTCSRVRRTLRICARRVRGYICRALCAPEVFAGAPDAANVCLRRPQLRLA